MAATSSPALPPFSYAQAAKGLAPATSAQHPQADSTVNTPETSSTERKASIPEPERLESLHHTASAAKNDEIPNDVVSQTVYDDVDIASTAKFNPDNTCSSTTKPTSSSSHPDSKQVSESTSPSLEASVATLPREEESSSTQNDSSESWDKQSETSAIAEKSGQATEGGKEKSVDEDWVNVPALKAEKELKAAPIPAVNIWQQRKEAQEAKAKANAVSRPSSTLTAPTKSITQVQSTRHVEAQAQDDETKRRPPGKIPDRGDGTSKKKQVDDTKIRDDGKCLFLPCRFGLLS